MTDASDGASDFNRRGFKQLAAAAAGLAGALGAALAQPWRKLGDITRQPHPSFTAELNISDIFDESLFAWAHFAPSG